MSEPESMNLLAMKHGTDKSSRWHGYTRLYERAFTDLRKREPGKILEIGVWKGGSLRLWRDWFPKTWEVIGVENGSQTAGEVVDVEGCLTVKANAANREAMARMGKDLGPFDIVIDDGSHKGHEQIASFEALWPCVRPGGVFVIEDLHDAYQQPGFGTVIMDWLLERLHDVMAHGRWACADLSNHPDWDRIRDELNEYEATIDRMEFHRSIVFIWRKP